MLGPSALAGSWILLQLLLVQLLLVQLLLVPGTSGIKCYRTETGFQPHTRDCGSSAQGCKIIVKPYKHQNNSAVATCRNDERFGDYTYDCAVDCPSKDKWDWNEVECCKTDNCNSDLKTINSNNFCYVSKPKSTVLDRIDVCKAGQKCALNQQSGETACVGDAECSGGKWVCCTDTKNCGQNWGVYKVENVPREEESTDANNVTASLALSVMSLVIYAVMS